MAFQKIPSESKQAQPVDGEIYLFVDFFATSRASSILECAGVDGKGGAIRDRVQSDTAQMRLALLEAGEAYTFLLSIGCSVREGALVGRLAGNRSDNGPKAGLPGASHHVPHTHPPFGNDFITFGEIPRDQTFAQGRQRERH